jgi:hypothetical protein
MMLDIWIRTSHIPGNGSTVLSPSGANSGEGIGSHLLHSILCRLHQEFEAGDIVFYRLEHL